MNEKCVQWHVFLFNSRISFRDSSPRFPTQLAKSGSSNGKASINHTMHQSGWYDFFRDSFNYWWPCSLLHSRRRRFALCQYHRAQDEDAGIVPRLSAIASNEEEQELHSHTDFCDSRNPSAVSTGHRHAKAS